MKHPRCLKPVEHGQQKLLAFGRVQSIMQVLWQKMSEAEGDGDGDVVSMVNSSYYINSYAGYIYYSWFSIDCR